MIQILLLNDYTFNLFTIPNCKEIKLNLNSFIIHLIHLCRINNKWIKYGFVYNSFTKIKINKHKEKEKRKNHEANILQNTINLKWMDESVTSNRNRFVYLTNRIKVTHLLNK